MHRIIVLRTRFFVGEPEGHLESYRRYVLSYLLSLSHSLCERATIEIGTLTRKPKMIRTDSYHKTTIWIES